MMMMHLLSLVVMLALFLALCSAFRPTTMPTRVQYHSSGLFCETTSDSFGGGSSDEDKEMQKALQNARDCVAKGVSPGAGLDAFESADAAYADLILTSMEQRNVTQLSSNELKRLNKGGKMWEKGVLEQKQQGGLLGSLFNAIGAVAGGAQIEKNKYGET